LETETLKCPNCGKITSITELKKDAWRCRGCTEYMPYDIRSKYFRVKK
jgi:acetyl-CoA carboxylase beta subunit